MESGRGSTTSMLGAMICLFWMVGFVSPTSVHTVAHNSSHNSSHDHSLRSASSKTASLGDSDNALLSELKEIVLFLSQKIDDSDARIQSLEDKARAQELTINNLQNEANDGSSVHRYLQNQECLPTFLQTSFGPRCVFSAVTRFENRTFFNDDVVFNENVEFDADANCMPTFNSTTQMCRINNNYTFDEGEIIFDYNVRFDEDVRFNDDVRFRDTVLLESDVKFEGGGEVTFDKDTKFHQNVVISNDDHDIEFTIEKKVTTKIYGDELKVDTHTTFYEDVKLEKDLQVDGKLKVEKLTELDDLELWGSLWVDKETRLDGTLEANQRATIKNGLTVKTGGLEVSSHGFQVHGPTTLTGTFDLIGDSYIHGKVNVDGRVIAKTMKIDNTKTTTRNLQPPMSNEPLLPVLLALEVIGDAVVTGDFYADVIRTDDFKEIVSVVDEISRQVVNELMNDNLIVKDLTIRNNGKSETVLTQSRMVELMDGMALKVDSITANEATINGESVPTSNSQMTSDEVIDLLLNSEGYVTIPKLKSYDVKIQDEIEFVGGVPTVISEAKLKLQGNNVANDIATLDQKVESLESSNSIQPQTMTSTEIVQALKGKTLSVSSLDASSLTKSGVDVATKNDVDKMGADVQNTVAASQSSCECSDDDIKAVVTKNYVKSMDFVTNNSLEAMDLGGDCACTAADLEELGVSFETSDAAECSCSEDFVQGVIDKKYIKGKLVELNVPFGNDPFCTCSNKDIRDAVTVGHVEGLGFVTSP